MSQSHPTGHRGSRQRRKIDLFNRITGQRRRFELIDTGGIAVDDSEYIPSQILKQARVALGRGCIQDSRAFCQQFFQWYNEDQLHSGIGVLTAAVAHFREASTVLAHSLWINKPATAGQKTKEDSQ